MDLYQVIVMFLLGSSKCTAIFIDPSDLFKTDENNLEISKKKTKGYNEHKKNEHELVKSPDGDLPPDKESEYESPSSYTEIEKDGKVNESTAILKCNDDMQTEEAFIFFQQHVMKIWQLSKSKMVDGPFEFCLTMGATQHDLSILEKFGRGDRSALKEAHEKLNTLITGVCDLPSSNSHIWLQTKLGLSPTVLFQVITLLLILLLFLKTVLSIQLTWSNIWRILMVIFVISVGFTWLEMYQRKIADKERVLMDGMSTRCPHLTEISIFHRFFNFLSSTITFQHEDCKELYEAIYINPITQVNPFEAVSVTAAKIVVAPMKFIGIGIKDFMTGLVKDLPFQYVIVLLIMMVVFAIYIPFLVSGHTLRTPFLTLGPANNNREAIAARQEPVNVQEAIAARQEPVNVQEAIAARQELVKIQEEAIAAKQESVKVQKAIAAREEAGKVQEAIVAREEAVKVQEAIAAREEAVKVQEEAIAARKESVKVQEAIAARENKVKIQKAIVAREEHGQGDTEYNKLTKASSSSKLQLSRPSLLERHKNITEHGQTRKSSDVYNSKFSGQNISSQDKQNVHHVSKPRSPTVKKSHQQKIIADSEFSSPHLSREESNREDENFVHLELSDLDTPLDSQNSEDTSGHKSKHFMNKNPEIICNENSLETDLTDLNIDRDT